MTLEQVASLIRYCPKTGRFSWVVLRPGCRAGDECGSVTVHGYNRVTVGGVEYRAARLAFALMTGRWPSDFVDHINGDKLDDRWENLREATARENSLNVSPRGVVKGISWDKQRRKWIAQARIEGKKKNLGRYDCFGAAVVAHRLACKPVHGEFYRAT